MKILKPLIFILAGMAIAFLVSFKFEVPKKEYCVVTNKRGKWVVHNPDLTKSEFAANGDFGLGQTELINTLAKKGWVINSVASFIPGEVIIYLERIRE